jgi:hypothetical protein
MSYQHSITGRTCAKELRSHQVLLGEVLAVIAKIIAKSITKFCYEVKSVIDSMQAWRDLQFATLPLQT